MRQCTEIDKQTNSFQPRTNILIIRKPLRQLPQGQDDLTTRVISPMLHTTVIQCMYGHHLQRTGINSGMVANPAIDSSKLDQEFPCPRSSLRFWSRETGSAIRPRVSPIIFHAQAESGAYSRVLLLSTKASVYTVNRHRVCPEYIWSRFYVRMAFTVESPPAQGR